VVDDLNCSALVVETRGMFFSFFHLSD